MSSTDSKYLRNIEDVSKIIQHAKLEENTLLPVTQALYFADEIKEYKLLELNKDLLRKLQEGVVLTFRGVESDKAVLCCDSNTYEVKEAETSNSLLLTPSLKFPNDTTSSSNGDRILEHKTVLGVYHTYYEVKLCKPKMKRLRMILEESAYRGSELESELIDSGVKLYSTTDLLQNIQASETELRDALKELFAFELNGKWRLLEFDYHARILAYLLNLIDAQSWNVNDIPLNEAVHILEDLIPSFIIQHIMALYCEPLPSSSDTPKVRLNEDRVCRALGEELLKSHSKYELNEFLKVWQESVPQGLTTKMSQLDELVYSLGPPNRLEIQYCPEYQLSEDLGERMQYLFEVKSKWTFDEIKPYIQIFTTPRMDENGILTKYARISKSNGVRLFSSRHGK